MTLYHVFFIVQKTTAVIGGTSYDYWPVDINGSTYYLMEPGNPRPDGYNVHNIVRVLASAAGNDLIYFVTTEKNVALLATEATEYAGASTNRNFRVGQVSAWLTFAVLSFLDRAGHAVLPTGAAAKAALPCRWLNVSDEWVDGTIADWVTAGYPIKGFHVNMAVDIL